MLDGVEAEAIAQPRHKIGQPVLRGGLTGRDLGGRKGFGDGGRQAQSVDAEPCVHLVNPALKQGGDAACIAHGLGKADLDRDRFTIHPLQIQP